MADDVASSAPVESLDQVGATIRLAYAFLPNPNPIRASAPGANPNSLDLQVIVSNPTLAAVPVREITIEIPTGEDTSRAISSAPSLPAPVYDTTGAWTISSAVGTITIAPTSGSIGQVLSPIIFTLPGIRVNETPGTVPLTITELPPGSAPKVVDTSQSLLKQPADFPVVSFTAMPAILNDLDDSVTLSWACTDQGKQDAYSVYSDTWQPVDCINDGDCYSWQDGQAGIQTSALGQTTVFYLDVITTSSTGERTVVATLQTTVWLAVPSISTLSRLDQVYSGRQVTLRWLAYNAGSCSVAVNGVTVAPSAPVDTYRSGYPLTLEGPAGAYQVSVAANAVTGPASSTYTFPQVSVGPRLSIPAGTSPSAVAVTKDGRQAAVVSAPSSTLTVVDVAARQPEPGVVNFEDVPWSVAVTPDGSLALVTHGYSETWYVAVVDLKQLVLLQTISLPGTLGMLAVTPDGTLALVATGQSNSLGVIDIASRSAEAKAIPTGEFPYGVAITPDGTLALVTNWVGNSVTVIDVAQRAAEPSAIPVGRAPRGIAITPDGKLALVANWSNNTVGVIDIASRTAEPKEIAVGAQPDSLAISSNGRYALVPSAQDSTVTIVDVIARAAVSMVPGISVPGVGGPAVAMLPGGPNALVASMNQNSLALL